MAHKEFKVALGATVDDDSIEREPITFTLTGDAYRYESRTTYKEDALALVVARLQRSKGIDSIGHLEDTMRTLLTSDSADHLFNRITDPSDGLRLEHLIPVMEWLVREIAEAAGGRPTVSQPA